MELTLREVTTRKAWKTYIHLPSVLYADQPQWVPPIYADEWNFHNPDYNTSLASSTVTRVIAHRGEQPVGRIMGIIYHTYNEQRGETHARFFNFDCLNDPAIAHALIEYVAHWAVRNGMNKLIGPYGFSDKDPQGSFFLISPYLIE